MNARMCGKNVFKFRSKNVELTIYPENVVVRSGRKSIVVFKSKTTIYKNRITVNGMVMTNIENKFNYIELDFTLL